MLPGGGTDGAVAPLRTPPPGADFPGGGGTDPPPGFWLMELLRDGFKVVEDAEECPLACPPHLFAVDGGGAALLDVDGDDMPCCVGAGPDFFGGGAEGLLVESLLLVVAEEGGPDDDVDPFLAPSMYGPLLSFILALAGFNFVPCTISLSRAPRAG